jgi:hypothetical protein
LTARRLWKFYRPRERLHWLNSVKRHWMISLPGMLWGCIESLDMWGYKEMKLSTSLQETILLCSLLDLSQLWEFLGRI